MRYAMRTFRQKRIQCNSGMMFSVIEDFADRYENLAIADPAYSAFIIGSGKTGLPPFYRNCHVYSCLLILNSLPHRWRRRSRARGSENSYPNSPVDPSAKSGKLKGFQQPCLGLLLPFGAFLSGLQIRLDFSQTAFFTFQGLNA